MEFILALNIFVHFFVLVYAFGLLHVVDLMLALQIDIWVDIFVAKMFPEMCKDTSAVM